MAHIDAGRGAVHPITVIPGRLEDAITADGVYRLVRRGFLIGAHALRATAATWLTVLTDELKNQRNDFHDLCHSFIDEFLST